MGDPTFIFTTTTEEPSTIRTSIKSLNLFNSQYFNVTTDFSDYHQTDSDDDNDGIKTTSNPSFNEIHLYKTEESANSPQMYSEDMTEVIIISNYTELERTPRENGDDDDASFENLDGPYQRLQARYGSWKNQALDLHQDFFL